MRVLVTGASGFIGRHLVRRLLTDGHDVAGLDRRGWAEAPCRVDEVDVRDAEAVRRTMLELRPEAVFHLASLVGVRTSAQDATGYRETNVVGTEMVVRAATESSVPRLVFSSSSSVYGAVTTRPSEEDDALDPRSPYAETKAKAELIVRGFEGQSTITRLFTVYGPGMRTDLALRRFIDAIVNDRPIMMFGDGRSERDYTHVADIVDGLAACLRRDGPNHLTCNLGSGSPVALATVIETLCARLGHTPPIVRGAEHPADAKHTHACLRRAAEHLGYRPRFSFERGVDDLLHHLARCSQRAHPVPSKWHR